MADSPTAPPIIALDTNSLVQSIPTRGRFRPIIEGFDAGRFLLVVSNEILLEYEEILKAIGGPMAWSAFESLLIARAGFVRRVAPTYSWRAIVYDPDDNKFVDAAVAGEADWIVTEDSYYNVLFQDTRLTVRPLHPTLFIERYLYRAERRDCMQLRRCALRCGRPALRRGIFVAPFPSVHFSLSAPERRLPKMLNSNLLS